MLKRIARAVSRLICAIQPIFFVAFAQPADAQNDRVVSAARLQHRVPTEARQAYERALKTAKSDRRPEVEAGAKDLERAVTIDPEFTQAQGRLGFSYFRLGRFEEASSAFRRAIALDPKFPRWHAELGWALFGLGNDAEAQECAKRALRLAPANASAHLLLGVLLSSSAENRSESLLHLVEGSYYLQKAQ
jgi:tetratricopeptide (TPR) repeat protein